MVIVDRKQAESQGKGQTRPVCSVGCFTLKSSENKKTDHQKNCIALKIEGENNPHWQVRKKTKQKKPTCDYHILCSFSSHSLALYKHHLCGAKIQSIHLISLYTFQLFFRTKIGQKKLLPVPSTAIQLAEFDGHPLIQMKYNQYR